MSKYFQIAVNFPRRQSVLTYKSELPLQRGDLVEVPLGKRNASGVVINESSDENLKAIKKIESIKAISQFLPNSFSVMEKELKLYEWMSNYYHYSLGKLVFDCLPKFLKRPRKVEEIVGKSLDRDFSLSEKQISIVDSIKKELPKGFSQHYIHGVTGSGKSVVYMELIKETLAKGKSVQFLLPEINLTPQFIELFSKHLDCKIYSYHSAVSGSEKYSVWKNLSESDEPVFIMGVRSSVFLPFKNLGLIIVDEEHDSSFKQADRCPYNGKDVAIKKAHIHNCPVVLGSATPTVENYNNFSNHENNRFYYEMPDRVGDGYFPSLTTLDIRDKFKEADSAYPLLEETIDKMRARLKNGEQVLVFINKLGYSSFIQCRSCGHQFMNDKCGCENNLRYFKKRGELSCAHCDFKMPVPESCPECASMSLLNKGYGTEKVAMVLSAIFPEYAVERFDRDEIKNMHDLGQRLQDFHDKKIDILVGTQMLSKGHNFERVNLVVMLGVDGMLNFADFRSSEKMYQQTLQVAGRAGRYNPDSEVVIQTMNPEHAIFNIIKNGAFNEFYSGELDLRQLCFCPPYSKIAIVYFNSRFRERAVETSVAAANGISKLIETNFENVRMFGPSPMGIEKKAGQYSWMIMLKSDNINELHNTLNSFESSYKVISNVSYKIDVDPL